MRLLALGVLTVAACSGPTKPRLPPPAAGPPAVQDLDAGVLRGLMIEGVLQVPIDDETRAAMAADRRNLVTFDVSVCLDSEGAATVTEVRPSGYAAYDAEARLAIAGWRFRPYVRDGVISAGCAMATFSALREDERAPFGDVPAGPRDALPAAAVELPPSVESSDLIPYRETDVPPTPGVALAIACRRLGARAAPRVTLVQSSGDPAIDRGLLDRRITMPRGERPGPEGCALRSAITPAGALPPAATLTIAELRERRTSGDVRVFPAVLLRNLHYRRVNAGRIVARIKLCIDPSGRVDVAVPMESSGYLGYDADLVNAMATWRYRPLVTAGKAMRACTMVSWGYHQSHRGML